MSPSVLQLPQVRLPSSDKNSSYPLSHALTQVRLPSYLFFVLLQGLYRDNTELIVSMSPLGGEAAFTVLSQKPSHLRHPKVICLGVVLGRLRYMCDYVIFLCSGQDTRKCPARSLHRAQSVSNYDLPVTGTGVKCPISVLITERHSNWAIFSNP